MPKLSLGYVVQSGAGGADGRISEEGEKETEEHRGEDDSGHTGCGSGGASQKADRGLLAGMYEFPSLEGHCKERQVSAYLKELGFSPIRIRELPPAKHVFTHKEWHMIGYLVRVDELANMEAEKTEQAFVFVEPEETKSAYPIPSAFAAYAAQVEMGRKAGKS